KQRHQGGEGDVARDGPAVVAQKHQKSVIDDAVCEHKRPQGALQGGSQEVATLLTQFDDESPIVNLTPCSLTIPSPWIMCIFSTFGVFGGKREQSSWRFLLVVAGLVPAIPIAGHCAPQFHSEQNMANGGWCGTAQDRERIESSAQTVRSRIGSLRFQIWSASH